MRSKVSQAAGGNKALYPQPSCTFPEGNRSTRPNLEAVLSVVVIAKNEAHNLPRCLASVARVADEIVVVDSGSTDGTKSIAEAHGARVFDRTFTTYAEQKNWAASQVEQPFVLSLDADEALSAELIAEILRWKSSTPITQKGAWSMPRLTHYCGAWIRHGGWYPDRKIRLWSKDSGTWATPQEGGMLHESWVPHEGVEVQALKSDLWHYSYHSTSDHLRQWAKFARLGAADAVLAKRGSSRVMPLIRAAHQWVKQALVQGGWRDGQAGLQVAKWSAYAAYWKWNMARGGAPFRNCQRIGVVRTDALGDNVVSLPIAGALKAMMPEVKVVWICKPYAVPLVTQSQVVDDVRTWQGGDAFDEATVALFEGLDAVVFAFPEATLMRAAASAKVPWRVATGRRWSGLVWANLRSWRSRRNRPDHEAIQGLRLLHRLALPAAWQFPESSDWRALTGLAKKRPPRNEGLGADPWSKSVVLHPGNHGSANGWSQSRFVDLAERLLSEGVHVIFSGTQAERARFASWLDGRADEPLLRDGMGAWTLEELVDVLGRVGVVVASSTGPLHIASALGTSVVGLYRSDAPFWPQRWSPLGPSKVLSTTRTLPNGGLDISAEEVHAAVHDILASTMD